MDRFIPQPYFGRIPSVPDARDDNFLLREAFPPELLETPIDGLPTWKYLKVPNPRLNQHQTSQCTIYGSKTCYLTGPNVLVARHSAQEMYDWAQQHDPWPGAEPAYFGTSTRASGAAAVHFGYATEYRWLRTIADMIRRLQFGPFMLGSDWYEGMSNLDRNFFANIRGERVGGHQFAFTGYNLKERKFRNPQTWGNGWGDDGMFWTSFDTVEQLLADGAEAVALMEVPAR